MNAFSYIFQYSYSQGFKEKDLRKNSAQVKQCFSLNNASDKEMYSARFNRIKDMLGKHALDCGNNGIQAAVHCERTITLLDHIRSNHKDVSALIRLQK